MRWLTLDDAGLMLSIWNDPAFVRHVGDRGVRSVQDAEQVMKKGPLRLYEDHGYGPYRVSLRSSDEAIGVCGLFRREGLEDADIGYALLPEYCGAGYATEAATAVFEHARDELRLTRLTAIISPDNAASVAVVRKLGMSFERMLRLPDDTKDVELYSVEW